MDLIRRVQQYLKHIYVRYLLATEMYMVETWELMVVHGLMAVLFIAFGFFNYALLINSVNQLKYMTCGDTDCVTPKYFYKT